MITKCDQCGAGAAVVRYGTGQIRIVTREGPNDTRRPPNETEIVTARGQTACASCRALLDLPSWEEFRDRMRSTYEQRHGMAFSALDQRERTRRELIWQTTFNAIQGARARGDIAAIALP